MFKRSLQSLRLVIPYYFWSIGSHIEYIEMFQIDLTLRYACRDDGMHKRTEAPIDARTDRDYFIFPLSLIRFGGVKTL